MTYYLIMLALAQGKRVCYKTSRRDVIVDENGMLLEVDVYTGAANRVSPESYDKCFICD